MMGATLITNGQKQIWRVGTKAIAAAHQADPDANSGVFHPPTKMQQTSSVCAQLGDAQRFLFCHQKKLANT
jgi:hypothetical protein